MQSEMEAIKRRKPEKPAPKISIRIDVPHIDVLNRIAESEGRTRMNLIRRVLAEYIRGRSA